MKPILNEIYTFVELWHFQFVNEICSEIDNKCNITGGNFPVFLLDDYSLSLPLFSFFFVFASIFYTHKLNDYTINIYKYTIEYAYRHRC